MKERATELEYLRWFYDNADFGPVEDSIRFWLSERFRAETGKDLPEGYEHYT